MHTTLIEEVVRGQESARWKVVVDQLTGSLIVTTAPSRHERINELLNRLEGTEQGARRPMRAYPIKHRKVSELVGLIQELVADGVLEKAATPAVAAGVDDTPQGPSSTPIGPPAPVVVGTKPDNSGSTLTIASDEASNRILAFGEGRLLDQLGLLIEGLDVQHAQVLVEALVVTLSESQTTALGFELRRLGTQDDALIHISSLFGLGVPDPALGALPAPTGAGFTGVVLDPGEFSALVRALETVNHGRSLTIPKVLVSNNQTATLDSTVQTPYAATNASTTGATTSFGGTFDAGTTISVQPQVTDGDQILLSYTVTLSSFVGEPTDPNLPPPRQQTRLESLAAIPDGHTVVVGGLEIDSEGESQARVPVLSSVPIVGEFFKSRAKSRSKSRFFVFLRCNVQRSSTFEDLRFASQAPIAEAGISSGWPELEPRVIR